MNPVRAGIGIRPQLNRIGGPMKRTWTFNFSCVQGAVWYCYDSKLYGLCLIPIWPSKLNPVQPRLESGHYRMVCLFFRNPCKTLRTIIAHQSIIYYSLFPHQTLRIVLNSPSIYQNWSRSDRKSELGRFWTESMGFLFSNRGTVSPNKKD